MTFLGGVEVRWGHFQFKFKKNTQLKMHFLHKFYTKRISEKFKQPREFFWTSSEQHLRIFQFNSTTFYNASTTSRKEIPSVEINVRRENFFGWVGRGWEDTQDILLTSDLHNDKWKSSRAKCHAEIDVSWGKIFWREWGLVEGSQGTWR